MYYNCNLFSPNSCPKCFIICFNFEDCNQRKNISLLHDYNVFLNSFLGVTELFGHALFAILFLRKQNLSSANSRVLSRSCKKAREKVLMCLFYWHGDTLESQMWNIDVLGGCSTQHEYFNPFQYNLFHSIICYTAFNAFICFKDTKEANYGTWN